MFPIYFVTWDVLDIQHLQDHIYSHANSKVQPSVTVLDQLKCLPDGGARQKFKGSAELLQFMLWGI